MLILMLAKKVCKGISAFKDGTLGEPVGMELRGKTLGVIGMGKIGTRTAEMCRAMGMDVIGVTSRSPRSELEALLTRADVVSIHCQLSSGTEGAHPTI